MFKLSVVLFCMFLIAGLSAQQNENVVLEWGVGKYGDEEFFESYDYIKGQGMNGSIELPYYSHVSPLRINKTLSQKAILLSYNSLAVNQREVEKINKYEIELSTEPQLISKVSNSAGQRYLILSLFPYFKEGGQIKKVNSFSYSLQSSPVPANASLSRATVYPLNSKLKDGNGEWYKLRVNSSGVYKIDKDLLMTMGVDVASVNPQNINIFGNATPILPISNAVTRPNDLEKNSITIFGETDGVFNDNDYILFYAQGPVAWDYYTGYGFRHQVNLYDDYSYYYLNINPSESAKRIINEAEIVLAPDFTVNEFNDYSYYELELENQTKGGKNWYGEKFDYILSYDYLFGFPNLKLTDSVKVNITSLAIQGAGTSTFDTRINGSLVNSVPVLSSTSSYRRNYSEFYYVPNSPSLNMNLTLNRDNPVLNVWLDYIELNVTRDLTLASGLTQMPFRNYEIVGNGFTLGEYTIQNAFNSQIWNITDPKNPTNVFTTVSGNNTVFKSTNDSLKEFVCLRSVPGLKPEFVGVVESQNLHALGFADYIIIYHPDFEDQAMRLGELHVSVGKQVNVVSIMEVYEEFSCGAKDPTAIKSFLKMFYDRAAGNPNLIPENVLLFGDGSYDPKNRISNNTDYIPAYEKNTNAIFESSISDMAIEDYYVILDDSESDAPFDLVDMGVGRLIARSREEAKILVDKIEHYLKNGSNLFTSSNVTCSADGGVSTFGEWRNFITLIADNQDFSHFVYQQEKVYDTLDLYYPDFNFEKLYIDAFPLEITTGGGRSPDLVQRLNERVKKGTLIANYCGHGGELGLATERIVTIPQIESWDNINKLMLFVSATCEFTRFDDPSRYSAGEVMALSGEGGAIVLYSTTRPVTFSVNDKLNKDLMERVLTRDVSGAPLTFGEIMRQTKVLSANAGSDNYRSFMTVGDPGMRLAIPEFNVVADSINSVAIASGLADTLRALKEIRISGHVEDNLGLKQTSYNGYVFPTVFDKEKLISTLGQTTEDNVIPVVIRDNVLYKGKATVLNGDFSFTFIVPKDINYNFGNGKLSFFADNDSVDNQGHEFNVIIGGIDTSATLDNLGPEIELFLNDENFANGGVTSESPVLIANVFDNSGVNTVGNGIGHDITVILDGDTQSPIVVNDFYSSDLDTYKSGKVNYPITDLEEGNHTLTFKVWDVHNNSAESSIEFVVANSSGLSLNHVLNYPNPFSTSTEFFYEHNQNCQFLETQIQIFSVSGKLVKTINQLVKTEGFRTEGIHWNGRDDYGDIIGKGVYIYRVSVVAPDGEKIEKFEKLVILN